MLGIFVALLIVFGIAVWLATMAAIRRVVIIRG
jgi:hypothetical protein